MKTCEGCCKLNKYNNCMIIHHKKIYRKRAFISKAGNLIFNIACKKYIKIKTNPNLKGTEEWETEI